MPECVVCGAETSVTASCPHCSAPVCAEHRDPASHDCAGVDAEHTDGWVIDLDGSATAEDRERGRRTEGWYGFLRPSRSGAWLAVGTLVVLLATVVAVAVVGPAADVPDGAVVASAGDGTHLNETRVERLVAERANEERRARGLDPLAYDRTLERVGEAHSEDMYDRGFVDHENPDGAGLRERYAAFGLDCPGGENIYYSPNGGLARTPEALATYVVDAWMDSEGHREALLRERFARQGVGVVLGSDGGVWVTQDSC